MTILSGYHKFKQVSTSVKLLLLTSFFLPFGSFMILPFIPIFLPKFTGISIAEVGVVLGISSLIQFGGGFIGGFVGHYLGLKRTMWIALLVRSIAFLMLAISYYHSYLMIPAIFIIMTGTALYVPPNKAYIIQYTPEENRGLILSLSNAVLNIGMALGTLIGGISILLDFSVTVIVVAVIYLLMFFLNIFFIKKEDKVIINKEDASGEINLKNLWYPLMIIFFGVAYFYFFQVYLGPYINHYYNNKIYSYLLIINSLIIFFAQPLASGWIQKRTFNTIFTMSFVILLIGFILISFNNLIYIFIGVILFSIGEIFILLKADLEIAKRILYKTVIGFGILRLIFGLGTLSSSMFGGVLYQNFENQLSNFWLILSSLGIIPLLVILLFSKFDRKELVNKKLTN